MWSIWLFLCAAFTVAKAVHVDMRGAISLGEEVANVFYQLFDDNTLVNFNSRRSFSTNLEEQLDKIKETDLCEGIVDSFCNTEIETLLLDYVVDLVRTVVSVFDGILNDEFCKFKYLQKGLKRVKSIVRNTIQDGEEVYRLTKVFKILAAVFLTNAVKLCDEVLDKNETNKDTVLIILRQQLVIALIRTENKHLALLCTAHRICPYQYDATTHLQYFLNLVKTMKEKSVKLFVEEFRRYYLQAAVIVNLEKNTLNRFKQILSDMVLKNSAKNAIVSITDVVQMRLSQIKSKATDEIVLEAILSDLDHLYVNNSNRPLETFLDGFRGWLKNKDSETLSSIMETLYNDLAAHFSEQVPEELVYKISTEVQVFLELTIGSSSGNQKI